MIWISDPRFPAVQILDGELILAAQLGEFEFDKPVDELVDRLGCLVRYKARGKVVKHDKLAYCFL